MRSAHSSPLSLTRIAACTLMAVTLLSACGKKDAEQGAAGAKMPPPQVGVITTKFQSGALETELPARVEAIRTAEVRARVNGVVLKRTFTEGSIVKQGQSLYQIDPAPYQAELNAAQASVGRAQANLTAASAIVDRYKLGVLITNVTMQNVQPPEQVQSAFDDAVKAGQDRARAGNEGQAYANDVIPRARGAANRLLEDASAYRSMVIENATGNASRFNQVVAEYAKAPGVTRDRMYLDTMQSIFSNTTKVMVDAKSGSNLLYLPLDKLVAQVAANDANVGRAHSGPGHAGNLVDFAGSHAKHRSGAPARLAQPRYFT